MVGWLVRLNWHWCRRGVEWSGTGGGSGLKAVRGWADVPGRVGVFAGSLDERWRIHSAIHRTCPLLLGSSPVLPRVLLQLGEIRQGAQRDAHRQSSDLHYRCLRCTTLTLPVFQGLFSSHPHLTPPSTTPQHYDLLQEQAVSVI